MIEGADQFVRALASLTGDGAESVGHAAAAAIAGTVTKSVRSACPTNLREKIGFTLVPAAEGQARAIVGFGVGPAQPRRTPLRGSLSPNPKRNDHVSQVTQAAVGQSLSSAMEAAEDSVGKRIEAILN